MNKMKELLDVSGFDCVLLKTSERIKDDNFYYFTGLDKKDDFTSRLRIRKSEKPIILMNSLEYGNIRKNNRFRVMKLETSEDFKKILSKLPKKIGINYSSTTLASMKYMKSIAKGKKFLDVSKHLTSIREKKTMKEISKIKTACKLTSEVFSYILGAVKPGMTEKELEKKIGNKMENMGVYPSFPTIVAAGRNSAVPHHVPGKDKIKKGILLVDIGVVYDNYCSDMTRTFFL